MVNSLQHERDLHHFMGTHAQYDQIDAEKYDETEVIEQKLNMNELARLESCGCCSWFPEGELEVLAIWLKNTKKSISQLICRTQ